MLCMSKDRYNVALRVFSKSIVICSECGSNMYPYSKPFGIDFPEAVFLMAKCDCGNHYKQLDNYIDILKECSSIG